MAARFLNSIMDILKDNLIGDEKVSKEYFDKNVVIIEY